jgi:hypothetical protein
VDAIAILGGLDLSFSLYARDEHVSSLLIKGKHVYLLLIVVRGQAQIATPHFFDAEDKICHIRLVGEKIHRENFINQGEGLDSWPLRYTAQWPPSNYAFHKSWNPQMWVFAVVPEFANKA